MRISDWSSDVCSSDLRQGQLDADKAQWEGEDQRNWDLLNRYYSIIGGNQWGQSGTSSGTSKSKKSGNIFGQVAGAGIAADGAFSDRRLKTGIRKIGEFADGLGRYVWTYIWGGPQHEGVMDIGRASCRERVCQYV